MAQPQAAVGVTRARLLARATRAFAEAGFSGTSIATLAQAGGLSKASVMHHFASKRRLYLEVLRGVAARLEGCLPGPDADAPAYVLGVARWAARHPDDARLMLRELVDNHERARTARAWPLTRLTARLHAALERAASEGILRTTPLEAAITAFGAACYAAAAQPSASRVHAAAADLDPDRFGPLLCSLLFAERGAA